MNPNIQKSIEFFWRKTIKDSNNSDRLYAVHYNILYERKNHITKPIYDIYDLPDGAQWKSLRSHTDDLDIQILNGLVNHFAKKDIRDLRYYPRETCALLSPEIEEKEKALISKLAIGYDCFELKIINGTSLNSIQLKTKIHFFDVEETKYSIIPDVPKIIVLPDFKDEIFNTILNPNFMDRTEAQAIIDKYNPPITIKF